MYGNEQTGTATMTHRLHQFMHRPGGGNGSTNRTVKAPVGKNMPAATNRIIDLLPSKDRARLLATCEPVLLPLREVLCEPGAPTRHVYFPAAMFISLVTAVDGKASLEVGMVGSEGILGATLSMGVNESPMHAVVQGAGVALRMTATEFRTALKQSPALQVCVNRYIYVLMGQLATSAGCLRFHNLQKRLSRWLLMTQDRANSDSFNITHEFLAYMLGVRRVGITNTAGELQRGKLIEYSRGRIAILDRRGLEKVACSCYEIDRQTYANILGPEADGRRRLVDAARRWPMGQPQ